MRIIMLLLFQVLFLFVSCKAQHDFEYLGELPKEKYVVHSVEAGEFIQTSGDSIQMRNRVYVQIDSFGQVRINGHQYPLKEFEQGLRYVMLNPENKDHLPENFQSAIIYGNFLGISINNYQPEQLLRIQFILQTVNQIAFSEMENFITEELKKDWTDINSEDAALVEEKFQIKFAMPIIEDRGIRIKLPKWSEEEPDITKLKARNVMTILVNAQNKVMIRAEPAEIDDIKPLVKRFLLNPNQREDLAETPKKAIISLRNDRGTNYKTYLDVYNQIKAAYNEIWEEEAIKRYNTSYGSLNQKEKNAIRTDFPLVISEAEPTNFGND